MLEGLTYYKYTIHSVRTNIRPTFFLSHSPELKNAPVVVSTEALFVFVRASYGP